ncbi:Putative uncharacterized protein [Taphrina deformans PYCC 5710]|uniref:GPI mannosyltransferase 2 n=1 Tax=Taphrina deformans (strain PYCC 5710 / ATCC 11124 / CBS 356.35 / IMI 108563 / JCM 9778 / NBRC 8474) TaxID=1097556 RepID=R4XAF2_TAPDE|nr:Putative uncharacterized protein [Taphrina deformans PYCC 5710]|eukprot:CCG81249.1 Putative uncharacterized protein [Taphrina deformans PYCC 5710]
MEQDPDATSLSETPLPEFSVAVENTVRGGDEPRRKAPPRRGLQRMKSAMRAREVPVLELSIHFFAYKALLLMLALISSALGVYDSSSRLIEDGPLLNHWDSVYFTHIGSKGYVFEQEFAFGPLMPYSCRWIPPILLGTLCHYIAVIMFYRVSLQTTGSERISKVATLLHIISPAGIFLCTGYTEPMYAALTFAALSILHSHPYLAACLFGLSGLTRTTGIISALYFLPKRPEPLRMLKTAVYGGIVCLPWLSTQAYAYYLFCPDRPWCTNSPPFIYSFVQDQYWNVGFGRYFTLSNLPLFVLSAPMYLLCFLSLDFSLLSVQQGLLTFITFTSAHAQIITRMSSAFPRIYLYLAQMLLQDERRGIWSHVVVFFVLYGMIQAVLFGAFLPPA